jgi:hypothetical protein
MDTFDEEPEVHIRAVTLGQLHLTRTVRALAVAVRSFGSHDWLCGAVIRRTSCTVIDTSEVLNEKNNWSGLGRVCSGGALIK